MTNQEIEQELRELRSLIMETQDLMLAPPMSAADQEVRKASNRAYWAVGLGMLTGTIYAAAISWIMW